MSQIQHLRQQTQDAFAELVRVGETYPHKQHMPFYQCLQQAFISMHLLLDDPTVIRLCDALQELRYACRQDPLLPGVTIWIGRSANPAGMSGVPMSFTITDVAQA